MRFTVDTISGLAFGADVNTLESDDDSSSATSTRSSRRCFAACSRPSRPGAGTSTARRSRARSQASLKVNAAIDGFVAAARQRLDADPARRAAPANLLEAMIVAADDPRLGNHRRRGLGQRHDDAARRRGHHRQHAGLGDLAALHASGGVWRGRAPRSMRVAGDPSAWTHRALRRAALARGLRQRDDAPQAGRAVRSCCRRCATRPSPTSGSRPTR